MTCICGLVSNGDVYIGGDSAGIADEAVRRLFFTSLGVLSLVRTAGVITIYL